MNASNQPILPIANPTLTVKAGGAFCCALSLALLLGLLPGIRQEH